MDGALDPLLRPKSIAVIGASQRPESFGRIVLDGLVAGGYQGRIVPVHPNHADVAGITAVPSLGETAPVDCALLAVGLDRLEIALEDAAAAGAKAAVVFGSAQGSARGGGPLDRRLAEIARGAGMALCGGNSMVSSISPTGATPPGIPIAVIQIPFTSSSSLTAAPPSPPWSITGATCASMR